MTPDVKITRAENGYIIETFTMGSNPVVFQEFDDLADWLYKYFNVQERKTVELRDHEKQL